MDFKIFINRFLSSIFLLIFSTFLIFYYIKYLNLIIIIIYLIIFLEVYFYFKLKKIIIYSYLFFSFILFEFYLFFSFELIFLITFILLIIFFDTFSYIFGSMFGKKKIAPLISPNKTYLGFIFGYIFSLILTYLLINNYLEIRIFQFTFIASVIIIFAFLGDIIQSYFKRKSNIKNSSNLIPGHGGFFDRFDGFILAVYLLPFFKLIL